jgi:hypothetical protein
MLVTVTWDNVSHWCDTDEATEEFVGDALSNVRNVTGDANATVAATFKDRNITQMMEECSGDRRRLEESPSFPSSGRRLDGHEAPLTLGLLMELTFKTDKTGDAWNSLVTEIEAGIEDAFHATLALVGVTLVSVEEYTPAPPPAPQEKKDDDDATALVVLLTLLGLLVLGAVCYVGCTWNDGWLSRVLWDPCFGPSDGGDAKKKKKKKTDSAANAVPNKSSEGAAAAGALASERRSLLGAPSAALARRPRHGTPHPAHEDRALGWARLAPATGGRARGASGTVRHATQQWGVGKKGDLQPLLTRV